MKKSHPSQVQVSLSNTHSSAPAPFYGSDVACNSWITLRVQTSDHERDLSNDWFFTKDLILELRMTPNQFTELLTTINTGGGVPATLTQMNNKAVPHGVIPEPVVEPKQEIFLDEIDSVSTEVVSHFQHLQEMIESAKLTQKEKKEILSALATTRSKITTRLPFILEQAKEQLNKAVMAGKAAIDSFYTGVITRLGIRSLRNESRVELLEKKEL